MVWIIMAIFPSRQALEIILNCLTLIYGLDRWSFKEYIIGSNVPMFGIRRETIKKGHLWFICVIVFHWNLQTAVVVCKKIKIFISMSINIDVLKLHCNSIVCTIELYRSNIQQEQSCAPSVWFVRRRFNRDRARSKSILKPCVETNCLKF